MKKERKRVKQIKIEKKWQRSQAVGYEILANNCYIQKWKKKKERLDEDSKHPPL